MRIANDASMPTGLVIREDDALNLIIAEGPHVGWVAQLDGHDWVLKRMATYVDIESVAKLLGSVARAIDQS